VFKNRQKYAHLTSVKWYIIERNGHDALKP